MLAVRVPPVGAHEASNVHRIKCGAVESNARAKYGVLASVELERRVRRQGTLTLRSKLICDRAQAVKLLVNSRVGDAVQWWEQGSTPAIGMRREHSHCGTRAGGVEVVAAGLREPHEPLEGCSTTSECITEGGSTPAWCGSRSGQVCCTRQQVNHMPYASLHGERELHERRAPVQNADAV